MEEHLTLKVNNLSLEARFSSGDKAVGAIITHPHPLYGGSMDNNVVWTAIRAFGEQGWSTLRFNFRGVGASTGSYGEGLAEVEDVSAAADFLKSRVSGPCWLVGYSFFSVSLLFSFSVSVINSELLKKELDGSISSGNHEPNMCLSIIKIMN